MKPLMMALVGALILGAWTRAADSPDLKHASAVESLLADLGSTDLKQQARAQQALVKLAYDAGAPGAEAHRAAFGRALADALRADRANHAARLWILRQMESIGRAEVVPALAATLADADPALREAARRALQHNPSAAAGAVLRDALAGAKDPAWRVAILNALGDRGEPAGAPALLNELASSNDEFRAAAALALAKIGDKSAARPLADAMNRGSAEARRAAADAYLLLAEKLVERGDKPAALAMFQSLLSSGGHLRCAALVGLGRAGGAAEIPTLLAALEDPSPAVRGAAIEGLDLLPAPATGPAMAARVKSASPEGRVALLRALAARGDRNAQGVFLASVQDSVEEVRVEAIRGLALVGDSAAVKVLLPIAAARTRLREPARQSLERLAGTDIDSTLVAALPAAETPVRVEIIRSLAARKADAAIPVFVRGTQDPESAVRIEALRALGLLADEKVLAPVIAILRSAEDTSERDEASKAAVAISRRIADPGARAEPLLGALAGTEGAHRAAVLSALGRLGGEKPLQALRAALKDADPAIRDAAIRALAETADANAAGDLLSLARADGELKYHVITLQAYLRLIAASSDRAAAERLAMYGDALVVARRVEEKRLALAGLGQIRQVESLRLVVPFLDDPALSEEAANVAVTIARDLGSRDPEVVRPAMQKVTQVAKNDRTRQSANEILESLNRNP